jgi:hypothetical protein
MLQARRARRTPTSCWWAGLGAAALACTGSFDDPVRGERDGGLQPSPSGGASSGEPPEPDAGAGGSGAGGSGGTGASGGGGTAGAAGSGSLGGSAGAGGATSSGPFCDAVEEVFLPSCGTGSCHSNPNATIGDFAVGREEAESFVDVPSSRNPACGLIIDSSDPAQSLLLRKLTAGEFETPTCGGLMPVIGRDLTRAEIACVASWLEQFRR